MPLPDREVMIAVNGTALWTATRGSGPPVVLLHGGPGICDYLGSVSDMLEDVATVHRYEQRGCGRSPATEPIDIPTLVADLEALRVAFGHKRWALLGHSWGSSLALEYAFAHPDRVTKLVRLSSASFHDRWRAEHRANARARLSEEERAHRDDVQRRLAAGERDPRLEQEAMELLLLTDFCDRSRVAALPRPLFAFPTNWALNTRLVAERAARIAADDYPARARGLRIPTLVIHGERDPRPAWAAREVADLLPDARFVLLPDVGHEPFWERPELLRSELRSFLQ